jgi:hypothetical protein
MNVRPTLSRIHPRPAPTVAETLEYAARQAKHRINYGTHPGGGSLDFRPVELNGRAPEGLDLHRTPHRVIQDGERPDSFVYLHQGRVYFYQHIEIFPPSPSHPPYDRWYDLGPASQFNGS